MDFRKSQLIRTIRILQNKKCPKTTKENEIGKAIKNFKGKSNAETAFDN